MATLPLAVVSLAPTGRADLPEVLAIEALTSSRPWLLGAFLTELARACRRYLVARSVSPGSADGSGRDTAAGSARRGGATGGQGVVGPWSSGSPGWRCSHTRRRS